MDTRTDLPEVDMPSAFVHSVCTEPGERETSTSPAWPAGSEVIFIADVVCPVSGGVVGTCTVHAAREGAAPVRLVEVDGADVGQIDRDELVCAFEAALNR